MNVAIIAPHPDDESIGCGGTICNHVNDGDAVTAVFLSSGELGLAHLPGEEAARVREAEAQAAACVLGLEELIFLRLADLSVDGSDEQAAVRLRRALSGAQPELVYVPHPLEAHPDHKATLPLVLNALRETDMRTATLLAYEVWTPLPDHDCVNDVTSVMERKLEAIRCYHSQLEQFRYDDAASGLNAFRGALAGGCRYAEAFSYDWSAGVS